jgi:hypothetical protein
LKRITRTILEEITNIVPDRDRVSIIESRGNHIINSAINLIETIELHFGEEVAGEMERRLVNSIRAKCAAKFSRGAKKSTESQKGGPEVSADLGTIN